MDNRDERAYRGSVLFTIHPRRAMKTKTHIRAGGDIQARAFGAGKYDTTS